MLQQDNGYKRFMCLTVLLAFCLSTVKVCKNLSLFSSLFESVESVLFFILIWNHNPELYQSTSESSWALAAVVARPPVLTVQLCAVCMEMMWGCCCCCWLIWMCKCPERGQWESLQVFIWDLGIWVVLPFTFIIVKVKGTYNKSDLVSINYCCFWCTDVLDRISQCNCTVSDDYLRKTLSLGLSLLYTWC